ncbi:MAG TPA: phospholipase D-like domain-containing protein [Candidatus Methylomirabilis sp.]|nr:phospholipase D-like domain-containing protein [Candidatus Methylomirabilis sp.]
MAAELGEALYAATARRVHIRVLDREKAEVEFAIRDLRWHNLPVHTLGVPEQSLMHHKFAVFDERLFVTGSYNRTRSAEHANYENLAILDDPVGVAQFRREFQQLWQEGGGVGFRSRRTPPESSGAPVSQNQCFWCQAPDLWV